MEFTWVSWKVQLMKRSGNQIDSWQFGRNLLRDRDVGRNLDAQVRLFWTTWLAVFMTDSHDSHDKLIWEYDFVLCMMIKETFSDGVEAPNMRWGIRIYEWTSRSRQSWSDWVVVVCWVVSGGKSVGVNAPSAYECNILGYHISRNEPFLHVKWGFVRKVTPFQCNHYGGDWILESLPATIWNMVWRDKLFLWIDLSSLACLLCPVFFLSREV